VKDSSMPSRSVNP